MVCLRGGYKTQTVAQLANVIWAFNTEKISLRAFRIYFAALVIVAAREAARRSKTAETRKRGLSQPRYLIKELSRLTGCPLSRVRGELRELEQSGLLLFSETDISFTVTALPGTADLSESLSCGRSPARPVPLPRPVLRYLAKCSKPATIKTVLAYCVRGLTLARTGALTGKGTAKASWIAEVAGLSVRAVRMARAELIELGLITDDEGSKQWKLNRDGAYFTVNLDWTGNLERTGPTAVDNPAPVASSFSPPKPQICRTFSPPYEDLKTPNGSKNQKPVHTPVRSGFCNSKREGEAARNKVFRTNQVKNCTLKDIQIEDLRRVSTLKVLYAQAVSAKWLPDSESNFQNFVAAAVRATRVHGDPVRLFVSIVRRQLWHHITHEQEDRAREAINKYLVNGLSLPKAKTSIEQPTGISELVSRLGIFVPRRMS